MAASDSINTAPPPSSFDNNPDFYEESRWKKLKRRLVEEPLIPLGCLLTCWALFEASRSIRSGDKYRTNRMFRRRIYAQGFTIVAMLAGSYYWESDRAKRDEFNELIDEKKRREKHEAWLKELEVRAEEDEELRTERANIMKRRVAERQKADGGELKTKAAEKQTQDGKPAKAGADVQSVLEAVEQRRPGHILTAASYLWRSRR